MSSIPSYSKLNLCRYGMKNGTHMAVDSCIEQTSGSIDILLQHWS